MTAATVEIVGKIAAHQVGGRDRLIGRIGPDRFALGELTAEGTFDRKTPIVSFEDVARIADGVLSGDSRALTWPHTAMVLALGLGAIRALLMFDLPLRPDGPPAGSDAPAGSQPPSLTPAGALPRPDPDQAAAGAPAGSPRAGALPGRLL